MTTIPQTMQAVLLNGHGGPEMLEYRTDWLVPTPGENEVLIKVAACGLNNTDINTRVGWYSKSIDGPTDSGATSDDDDGAWGGKLIFPRIQGADVAGTVAAVGPGADTALVGRRVMVDTWLRDWDDPMDLYKTGYFGSEANGGYADFTTVDHRNVHPIDCDLSDAELATFATSYVTAENMMNRAEVREGDTVLITGASGGVGSALIQLANRRGATTIAMCGDSKADQVREIGPDAILPRAPENLQQALEEATGQRNVTVVADVVGGSIWPQLIDCIARGGRYTCSGAIAGPMVDFDLRSFYLNDLTMTGATIVPPGTFADLVGYVERGEIRPLLAATYLLSEVNAAQEAFLAKQHVGNIVLTM